LIVISLSGSYQVSVSLPECESMELYDGGGSVTSSDIQAHDDVIKEHYKSQLDLCHFMELSSDLRIEILSTLDFYGRFCFGGA
jgi:hypothetical protein